MRRIKRNSDFQLTSMLYAVLFLGMWVYFGFIIDYVLFFQEKSSLFIFSFDFLSENLHKPGGALIYIGKFLTAFFYFPAIGGAIVSGVIILIVLTISKIFLLLAGFKGRFISFIIGAALFYIFTDYHFLFFNDIGLLLQLLFFYLAVKYNRFANGWIPILVIPFVYFLSGGFAWIYLFLMTFYYLINKAHRGLIKVLLIWLFSIIIIFLSKEYIYFQSVKEILAFPFSKFNNGSQTILILIVAGTISILPWSIIYSSHFHAGIDGPSFKRTLLMMFILISVFLIIAWQGYDKKNKQYFYVEKLFYQNKFDELITFNIENPSTNSLTGFLNNIALCEKNKLDDLLFHFRQDPEGRSLFLKWEMSEEILKRGGYFYYAVGMINEANRWAYENLIIKGHTPEGLKMLIKTELINGNFIVASKYIRLLSKTLFYRKSARKFEQMLFNDSAVRADPELGAKVKGRPKSDFFMVTDDPEINLDKVLLNDSLNKRAFDYKMAYLLLRKDSKSIFERVNEYGKFGLTQLPVHIEEAVVVYQSLKMTRLEDAGIIRINRATEERWKRFLTVFRQFGSNLKSAEPSLKKQFGNTFWYYAFYM